jgi:CheY-like chemotaxis protein
MYLHRPSKQMINRSNIFEIQCNRLSKMVTQKKGYRLLLSLEMQYLSKSLKCLNEYHSLHITHKKVDSTTNYDKADKPIGMRNNLRDFPSNSQNRIMIVEDEQDIARLFEIALVQNGFNVDVFIDPLSALSSYRSGLYDLLLLDVKMPNMTGFELYQKIKDIDNKARVCFITAYEESINSLKKLFPNLEVDCFVSKPVELHKLVDIVKLKLNNN